VLRYGLTDDADGRFAIDAVTGVITTTEGANFDHETAPAHQIVVEVTDVAGAKLDKIFEIVIDDVNEPLFTILDKAHAVDLSSAASETIAGVTGHNSFYIDVAAKTGKDVITDFGRDDVLLMTKAFYDGNNDGIIVAGRTHTFGVDGAGSADTVTMSNGVDSLRLLGETDAGLYVYADAEVRPVGAVESKISDDTLSGSGTVKKATTFFFDNALDIDLGTDKIVRFGANDLIVTTAEIENVNGKIAVDQSGHFGLPGGSGNASDGYLAGEGGRFAVVDTAGRAVSTLEFDGVVSHNDVTYYVYSQVGSTVGAYDLQF
jgi:hypothetical protein